MSADIYSIANCPRCGTELHPIAVRNSRSRVDNETLICSDCGLAEAMWNLTSPGRALPPLNERIVVAGTANDLG